MAKRDLYCFKSGKLELSILDEGLDEEIEEKLAYSNIESQRIYISLDQEDASMNSSEDNQEASFTSSSQPQLIITDEISHTLKTMSEFLIQTEVIEPEEIEEDTEKERVEAIVEEDTREEIVEALVEEDTEEEIVDTVEEDTKEETIEALVEEDTKEETIEALVEEDTKEGIVETLVDEDTEEEIVDTVKEDIKEDIVEAIVEAIVEEIVYTVEENIEEHIIEAIVEDIVEEMVEALVEGDSIGAVERDDRIAAIEENRVMKSFGINNTDQALLEAKEHQDEIADSYLDSSTDQVVNMKNMQHHIKSNTAMQQRLIDDILLSHFGEITTKFPYEKELKQKIERHIYKIKSYK